MKGTTPTKAERQFWDRLASIGCIACRKDGIFNGLVSIHHIDGRTKPGAHRRVLPLCFQHHQGGDGETVIPVHPWKARFEAKYGKQSELLDDCLQLLDPIERPRYTQ